MPSVPLWKEAVAEERSLAHHGHRRFLLIHAQFELLLDERPNAGHYPFACFPGLHEDVAVIRVAGEAVATRFQFLVKIVQHQVRQKRTQWSALWRAFAAVVDHAVVHHARRQERPHNLQQTFVLNVTGESRHQDVVVHAVEELLQVEVYDINVSIGYVLTG